jgi:hypothetical protein
MIDDKGGGSHVSHIRSCHQNSDLRRLFLTHRRSRTDSLCLIPSAAAHRGQQRHSPGGVLVVAMVGVLVVAMVVVVSSVECVAAILTWWDVGGGDGGSSEC